VVLWYISPRFGTFYKEKSGNPGHQSSSYCSDNLFAKEANMLPFIFELKPYYAEDVRIFNLPLVQEAICEKKTSSLCCHAKRLRLKIL
jgi:hypothetical protein